MFTQTPYPNLEVSGHYLHGMDNAPIPNSVTRLRHDYGLHAIIPTAWYPAETVLGFYEAVGMEDGGAFDLVAIGRHIIADLPFPSHVQTLPDALAAAPEMHGAAWRGGTAGELQVRWINERHAQIVYYDLPLPVDLVYGLCYGLVERFVPADTHNINVQRVARGNRYIFDLRW